MQRRFPSFSVSHRELAEGVLAYKGTILIDLGSRVERNPVLLVYDEQTPYYLPRLYPLETLPEGDDWSVDETVIAYGRRMPVGYRRHQMADARTRGGAGSLCVIEAASGDREESVSGVEVVRRAKVVFRALATGKPYPYPEAEADELEAHFHRFGDILLGETFYAADVGQAGTFWAIATMDDYPTLPSYVEQSIREPRRLYVGLHMTTRRGAVVTDWRNDRTRAVRRAFPFVANGRLSFERQTLSGDSLASTIVEGPWYQLDAEPEPVASGLELAELLQKHGGIDDGVAELLRTFSRFGEQDDNPSWVGLRYPSRDNELTWLLIALVPQELVTKAMLRKQGEGIRRDIFRDARVAVVRTHRVRQAELELRNRTTVPNGLAGKTVLLLGCGALGGDVAVTLAKAGVGRLILVDPDTIVAGNVIRHIAGLSATGLAKPDAVRQVVHQHNPFVDVEAVPRSSTQPREYVDELLGRADLAVSTVADENVELVINEAAVRLGKTVIYGRALRAGTCARVFRVRPKEDACKSCLALYRDAAERGEVTSWIVVPPIEGELLTRECGQPVLAGSAVDLRVAADLTARGVIDELGDGVDWNNLLWVRASWVDAPGAVATPYSVARSSFEPRPDCPVCARPRVTGIYLTDAAAVTLRRYAEAKPKVETGGALIGYEENGTVHILEVTDAGPAAEETETLFRYDASYVNEKLRDAAERLGTRGMYVGEWHTHLEPEPSPSARDIESLSDIAAAPNFLTDEPVMIIVGVDPRTGVVASSHASAFPVNRPMRAVALVEL